jgi:DNA-binding protein YbaB
MERLDVRALMDEVGHAIDEAAEYLEERRNREFVGTAADGLVTARIAEQRLQVEIHILAKRRLERDELAEAVVEAVREAEQQATDATFELSIERRAKSDTTDAFYREFHQAMAQMRSKVRF